MMARSSGSSGAAGKKNLSADRQFLRHAYTAIHAFTQHFETQVEDAVDAARARQLAASKGIEQTVRHLLFRYLLTDQAAGTIPRRPTGLVIKPDFVVALKMLDAAPLIDGLGRLHDAIVTLEPYEQVPFPRKPLVLRNAGGKAEARVTAGPEETALAALAIACQDLVKPFHDLAERLAVSCTTKTARRKKPKDEPAALLTPPKIAKRLGVASDKIRAWIRKGVLRATNVAAGCVGRPRYRITEEDLAKFQASRQPSKPTPKPPRRRKKDPNVIEFFK